MFGTCPSRLYEFQNQKWIKSLQSVREILRAPKTICFPIYQQHFGNWKSPQDGECNYQGLVFHVSLKPICGNWNLFSQSSCAMGQHDVTVATVLLRFQASNKHVQRFRHKSKPATKDADSMRMAFGFPWPFEFHLHLQRNGDWSASLPWNHHNLLVVYLPLWKMMEFVSWDDEIPNIWKKKTCSKPPTRFTMEFHSMIIFDPEFHRWSRTTLRALVVAQWAPSFLTDLEARPTSLRCRDGGQSDFWGSKVGWMLENHRDKVGYVQDTMKIPSGKRLHNYGKSPLLMGKSTISMAMFKFANC